LTQCRPVTFRSPFAAEAEKSEVARATTVWPHREDAIEKPFDKAPPTGASHLRTIALRAFVLCRGKRKLHSTVSGFLIFSMRFRRPPTKTGSGARIEWRRSYVTATEEVSEAVLVRCRSRERHQADCRWWTESASFFPASGESVPLPRTNCIAKCRSAALLHFSNHPC
jgi:hypothetical protein